jgi:hypothetical protein
MCLTRVCIEAIAQAEQRGLDPSIEVGRSKRDARMVITRDTHEAVRWMGRVEPDVLLM